ncbi:MAG: efflux RND transporter periplasmic adaptor subunit [Clostridiales bacterium]|jgi:RND family efflux transporter MFP subunit|nr:efflux RND transporter periplasmic adaptor subunit [Eubacteriales bacterium]MDH7567512.1 efflux RND transporter periplasmic adaptor subunit [Clostridiales bacterium]
MQKGLIRFFSAAMAALMLFASAGCSSRTTGNSSGVSVKTAVADNHKLETTLDVAGVLVPAQTVNVVSKISGQVTSLNLDVGASVKAGDILIKLDTKAMDAQMQQARAALQSAQAALKSVRNQAEQAKINLDLAQKAYERTKALADSNAASQSQLESDWSKFELARKQYEAATGSAQEQAQASVNTAQANINNIKVQLDNATITSPISGIVTNRNINPGEIASPGVTLLTIADTSTLKLKGTVAQEIMPLLKTGEEMNVFIDIYPNQVFAGKIESIGPMAVSTGEYFPIEISIKNPGNLKAGLSAHASVNLTGDQGVVVPASAVVQNNGQSYVFVIKNNTALKRTVTLGLKNDKEIEVLKGLDAGEQVAVTNISSLFDNIPVKVD